MIFKQYSHNGKIFSSNQLSSENWSLFVKAMTFCHSVQYIDGRFLSSSPDEEAISKSNFYFKISQLDGDQ